MQIKLYILENAVPIFAYVFYVWLRYQNNAKMHLFRIFAIVQKQMVIVLFLLDTQG